MIRLISLILLLFLADKGYSQQGFIEGKPSLAYWKVGDKSETVIVLHGGPAVQHEYLRPEFDALSKHAKVIYYDQRGCGKSEEAESYHWQEQVKDLSRVIQTFSKGKKVILAGSSWGSMLAMIYAYSHPEDVKGIILSGTVEWWGKQMNAQEYSAKAKHFKFAPNKKIKIKLQEQRIIRGRSAIGKLKLDTIQVVKTATYYVGPPSGEARVSFITAPVLDSLAKVTVPALIFNGSRKRCGGLVDRGDIYVKVFPNAELFTIDGACHDPWFSDPEKFFKRSNKFVSKIRRNRKAIK